MNTVDLFYYGADGSQLSFLQRLGMAVYSKNSTSSERLAQEETSPKQFEISVKSFGVQRNIIVEDCLPSLGKNRCDGFLYYHSHSDEALNELVIKMEMEPHYRVYLICHTYYSVFSEFEKFKKHNMDLSRVTFLTSQAHQQMDLLLIEDLKRYIHDFWQNEVFFVNTLKKPKVNSPQENSFFVLLLLKFLLIVRQILSPLRFTQNQMNRVKIILQVWELRYQELFGFLSFLISGRVYVDKNIWWIRFSELPGFLSFLSYGKTHVDTSIWAVRIQELKGFLLYFYGAYFVSVISKAYHGFRVILIRLGYLVRHILIIGTSKIYGVFVDLYYLTKRSVVRKPFDFIRHTVLMTYYKSYGVVVDSFYFVHRYFVKFFGSFQGYVIRFYYFNRHYLLKFFHFLRHYCLQVYYFVRHWSLMTLFKSYGVVVDTYYLLRLIVIKTFYFTKHNILMARVMLIRFYYGIRHYLRLVGTWTVVGLKRSLRYSLFVSRRYLLFPFFKIYWFTNYQYQKRIKRK